MTKKPKKKKNKNKNSKNTKQLGLTRSERLKSAPDWISEFLVKGYSSHFGVGKKKAIQELETLGHSISKDYKRAVKEAQIEKRRKAEQRKLAKEQYLDESLVDSDETFAFIAGYTSGGAPYGVSWEELEADGELSAESSEIEKDDEELPF